MTTQNLNTKLSRPEVTVEVVEASLMPLKYSPHLVVAEELEYRTNPLPQPRD